MSALDPGEGRLAVVTGGTGFIGWSLCEALRDAGWRVRGVVRPSSANPLPEGIERRDTDLDAGALAPALDGASVVYHLAGITRALDLDTFLRVNRDGACAAAEAARDVDALFVLVSSQAAGGPGTPERARHEEHDPEPVSDYGRSKLASERALRELEGLRHVVVRPPGVYGRRDRDFLTLFKAAASGWVPRLGSPDKAYTLVHIDDTVAALRLLARAGLAGDDGVLGETFFIGHPRPVTQGELLGSMAAAVGRRARQVPVPLPVLRLLAELGEWQGYLRGRPAVLNRSRFRELAAPGFVCSVDKIAERLGWRARVDIAEGARVTADWYREAGWLS